MKQTGEVDPYLFNPRRRATPAMAGACVGSVEPTPILDWRTVEVAALEAAVSRTDATGAGDFLRAAHGEIARKIRPAYALNECQRVSSTIRHGRGSCSQRFAVLEAVARRHGIATRVRGLVAHGAFWYPRFPGLTWLVPNRVILAWPEFHAGELWISASEIFGELGELAACGAGFANQGGETLFDAVAMTAVDWRGEAGVPACDLSPLIEDDLGYFESRDQLFATHGQTLSAIARLLVDPIMRRRSV